MVSLVVYSIDRSKAVVPVLLFGALRFILRGDLFYVLPCVIFFLVFFSPFCIAITSLVEQRANLSAFRTFIRFVLVWFCRFPLPHGVREVLRFVCDCGIPWTFLLLFFFICDLFSSLYMFSISSSFGALGRLCFVIVVLLLHPM